MHKLSNDIINLSLEKDTERTPTKHTYYLFKDSTIIAKGRFSVLRAKFDQIIEENKKIIEEATKEIREAPVEAQTIIRNWMNPMSNIAFFGSRVGERKSRNRPFRKTK